MHLDPYTMRPHSLTVPLDCVSTPFYRLSQPLSLSVWAFLPLPRGLRSQGGADHLLGGEPAVG